MTAHSSRRGLRSRLVAATWLVLSAQTIAFALGTAQVCLEGEHTHGGIVVRDCAMHHQAPGQAPAVPHSAHEPAVPRASHEHHGAHAHHAPPSPAKPASDDGSRMSCRCSDEIAPPFLGQAVLLLASVHVTPFVLAATLDRPSAPALVDALFTPPSPPPR